MEVSKKQLKDKLRYFNDLKEKMETNSFKQDEYGNKEDWSILQKMFSFWKMNFGEKQELENAWEGYYEAVRNSRSYERFQEQREAFKRGDIAKVKELGVEARQEREQKTDWIPKPSTVDPSLFAVNHKCKKYLDTLKSIKDITATLKKMGDEETLADDSFEGVKEIFNG